MPELVYSRARAASAWEEHSDREVLEALAEGSEAALDELIGRKTEPLMSLAFRILGDREEARDVVQVAFFRIWENRERYDRRWSPNTWIYRIVNNLAIDQLRSRRSREKSVEPVRQHMLRLAGQRSERRLADLHDAEIAGIFRELAGELTERQRSVFVLRELEGLSSQEVAEIVGCRESTVRNHLFNARKILRRELLGRYPEYAARYAPPDEEATR